MQSEIPEEIMMHAERLYDEGGYKTVPQIIAEAIMAERAALEAALSSAEPIRWMWEERRFAESDIWDDMYDDEPPAPHKYVRNVRPLYAAPPAPSVAVKALRWKGPDSHGEYHSLDGLWGYIIRSGNGNGFWLTEIGDYFTSPEAAQAAAQSDYETRILSALSAQVQDVAGWQPIDTAKKDRTIMLLWSSAWLHPIMGYWSGVQNCWLEYASRDTKANIATHWMPLPAAPAKQEG